MCFQGGGWEGWVFGLSCFSFEDREIKPQVCSFPFGVWVWKDTATSFVEFLRHIVWAISDGRKISVRSAIWCGDVSLVERFSNILSIAADPNSKRLDLLIFIQRLGGRWSD